LDAATLAVAVDRIERGFASGYFYKRAYIPAAKEKRDLAELYESECM
jgi:hypothetical protein